MIPLEFLPALEPKFWPKIEGGDFRECWVYRTVAQRGYGYGRITVQREFQRWSEGAHRIAYRLLVGEIPTGLDLDHLCRNPPCVNPWHLEPVTRLVNHHRAPKGRRGANNGGKTHCKRGHEFTLENTHLVPNGRQCRTCRQTAKAEWDRRNR